MNQKEKLFFDQLKDIFIGAKIEGKSGFINLMRIKSAHFDVIFKELNKEIEEETKDFPDFKEEMFDNYTRSLKPTSLSLEVCTLIILL